MTARSRLALLFGLSLLVLLLLAGSAAAATRPWWHLTQRLVPARVEPGGQGTVVVQAINLGDHPTAGRYEIVDQLPAGLELKKAEFFAPNPISETSRPDLGPSGSQKALGLCHTTATSVSCSSETGLGEEFLNPVVPYDLLTMKLKVKAKVGVESGANQLSASGGGAPLAQISRETRIDEEEIRFGLEHFALAPEEEGGQVATGAASHPYQLTADVAFNRNLDPFQPPATPRNLDFKLPPGQIGNAASYPKCSNVDFNTLLAGAAANTCPADTQIGATVISISTTPETEETLIVPVFNLEPAFGEPARFGFEAIKNPVILDTSLRSGNGEDYGVTVSVHNLTEVAGFTAATTVFWGAPGDSSHDESRGWGCIRGGFYHEQGGAPPCSNTPQLKPPAFLTLPGDCAHPFDVLFEGLSWPLKSAPEGVKAPSLEYNLQDEAGSPLSLTACNQVLFDPHIHAEPTSNAATSPTGLNFDIGFEDEGLLNPEGVAQSQIKKAVVTLPQGFTTNPSVAEGLKACSQQQYESETAESLPGTGCPNASKVGDVEIESPLVEEKVLGSLYVAQQKQNPNHNLLTLYLIAKNANLGILVRQALKVTPDETTGQLTTEVDNVPELPFSRFRLSFRQGQRSPLITPPACGPYAVKAKLYPWSNPGAPVQRESAFEIDAGPEGQGCPSGGVPPFHPGLLAGSENPTAGAYSPFYTEITRKDSEQEITHFSIKLPPGVVGNLSGVPFCSDAQIQQAKGLEKVLGGGTEELEHPSCPQASEIGRTNVGTGVGNVLAYAPGKLYLAGPYKGSQLSLVSITAAKVGPFDLGTVVVRFALRVNPETAEVSVDGASSDPIPHIVDGIPIHLRDIQAFVDRPNFTLNPTSCDKTSTASTVLGSGLDFASEADDQPVTVTSPFQVGSCASLPFHPQLSLKLLGGTKRAAHPALKATLRMNGIGEAAIGRSQVTLPKSEFLENAHIRTVCTRVQFKEGNGNGEKCPPGSIYGYARAKTPILSEPLEGPVFLRANGGERKLPDLVAALHAQEINVDLVGFIDSPHGPIRTTFEAVPDAPVTSFTLEMQGGSKGLLVNSTNLCQGTHKAIVDFTAHNGKVSDSTPAVGAKCRKGHKGKGHGKAHRRHRG